MDLLLLHFKQFLQKKSAISYLQTCNINLVFLSLIYSSTNQGKTGKSKNTSVVHGLHTSQLFCYSLQKFGSSISAGSSIALNSQSNAIGSRKNEPVWRSRRILDAVCDTCRLQTCRLADCRLADLQTCRLADLQTCRPADFCDVEKPCDTG